MCQYYLVDYFFNSKCIWRLNVIFSNAFVNGWFNGSTIVNDWIIAPSKLNFQISALIWLVIPFRWIYPARISLKDKINTYVMKICFLKTRYFFCKINLKEMHKYSVNYSMVHQTGTICLFGSSGLLVVLDLFLILSLKS